jgi:hypothetical protein
MREANQSHWRRKLFLFAFASDFRSWHLADMRRCRLFGRYRRDGGHPGNGPEMARLTQLGHEPRHGFSTTALGPQANCTGP